MNPYEGIQEALRLARQAHDDLNPITWGDVRDELQKAREALTTAVCYIESAAETGQ